MIRRHRGLDSGVAQRFGRSARADDFYVEALQFASEIHDSCLVGDANERTSYFTQTQFVVFRHLIDVKLEFGF